MVDSKQARAVEKKFVTNFIPAQGGILPDRVEMTPISQPIADLKSHANNIHHLLSSIGNLKPSTAKLNGVELKKLHAVYADRIYKNMLSVDINQFLSNENTHKKEQSVINQNP